MKNSNTMYCKVCMDAGKPKEMYNSHWVKNHCGIVVCPTLLSMKCQNCSIMGHTMKFCIKPLPTIIENRSVSDKKTKDLKNIIGIFPALSSHNITHQKHFATDINDGTSYMDCLIKMSEAKKIIDAKNALMYARSEREANEAKGIVEKPYLTRDMTYRGSANITLRDHQKHYVIEEGEEYDPFFGSEKTREILRHNHACFLGQGGLTWSDVIESDNEEEFDSDNEEEFEEEDYDW